MTNAQGYSATLEEAQITAGNMAIAMGKVYLAVVHGSRFVWCDENQMIFGGFFRDTYAVTAHYPDGTTVLIED
jgi:hypothetical protein